MKTFKFILLVFVVFTLGVAACTEESECYSENTSIIALDFFKLNELDPDTSFYEEDTLTFGEVYALGNEDSLLVDRESTTHETVLLPVDPRVNTTTFVIQSQRGTDTLTIQYNVSQRVLSPDCGVEQVFSNLDTLGYTFDSLVIKSRNLDRNAINFEIYSN